uniref:Uncharacterized protein n=1 Tax=Anguilla anguilla TaxID=7936 RepID=A0A0E9UYK9_ANGAN
MSYACSSCPTISYLPQQVPQGFCSTWTCLQGRKWLLSALKRGVWM